MESQRGSTTAPESPSWLVAEVELNPGSQLWNPSPYLPASAAGACILHSGHLGDGCDRPWPIGVGIFSNFLSLLS